MFSVLSFWHDSARLIFIFFVFLFKHFKKELNTLERVKNEYMRKNNEQVLYPFNFLSGYQVTFVETVCRWVWR